jgi:hypothetical protein
VARLLHWGANFGRAVSPNYGSFERIPDSVKAIYAHLIENFFIAKYGKASCKDLASTSNNWLGPDLRLPVDKLTRNFP